MKIVIIGGIAAGMSAAAKARRVDKTAEIIVIEKEDYISFGACGLPYYLGGQFTDANNMFARTPQQMSDSGIQLLLQHEVLAVNFSTKELKVKDLVQNKEQNMQYDRLLIATGAQPIIPQIVGLQAENMYTITRLAETERLKKALPTYKKIAIIGGGFIGLEVADQLVHLGKEVHIFERENHLMDKVFDAELSEKIELAAEQEKINLHLSEKVAKVENENNCIHSIVTNKKTYSFDAVIVAVGFRPNTAIFDDENLKKLANGAIVIDAYGRTSIPDVFSAGDCATVPTALMGDAYVPLATSANKLGRIVGTNIVSDIEHYELYPGSLRSSEIKIGQYEAGATGITEKQAQALQLDYKTALIETNNHSNYYPNQNTITIKLVYGAKDNKLLGAQVFGKDSAVLRMTGLTTAIYAGLTTKELGFIDYAYAPPFASTWEALNVAGNVAK